MTAAPDHILLIFVDGLGLPPGTLENSIYAVAPTLRGLLGRHAVPLDAGLGIPGEPQSATGQTALFTGINGARHLGRHLEGFPSAPLRAIIETHSLFQRLIAAGRTCTFANAYARAPGHELPMYVRSVTTVMTLAALGGTRNRDRLIDRQAVYHDITRECLPDQGVNDVPVVAEHHAAKDLIAIARTVDLCLFEYFLTDWAGHRGTLLEKQRVLQRLDALLEALVGQLDPTRELLLLTSDHGNIEAPDSRRHTTNPVPLVALGPGADILHTRCTSILDLTPCILKLLGD